jgi:hypothetical protein
MPAIPPQTATRKLRDSALVDECAPRELMRIVADHLTAHGFAVRDPVRDDCRRLAITSMRGMNCTVSVHDDGYIEWEYWPQEGHAADPDPAAITGLVMHVLTGDSGTCPHGDAHRSLPDVPLKGVIGHELNAAGLDVGLVVYEDMVAYDVTADIVVTNPGKPGRGVVYVSDTGALAWERRCWEELEDDTRRIAETIASMLSLAAAGSHEVAQGNDDTPPQATHWQS